MLRKRERERMVDPSPNETFLEIKEDRELLKKIVSKIYIINALVLNFFLMAENCKLFVEYTLSFNVNMSKRPIIWYKATRQI